MRWLVAVAWLCATAARADAKMMLHYDLAGLALQAECVVVADAAGPGPSGTTHYKIVRALRGPMPSPAEVDVFDSHYVMSGADARRVLFLGRFDGKLQLLSSGLRVVSGGLVFRFEQQNNPGPFVMVPQGRDPDDQWKSGIAQLDFAGLEAAIAAAGKRVDAFVAAKALTDPAKRRAAILAVLPPVDGRHASSFYFDTLGEAAQKVLVDGGDLDGALEALEHEHGGHRRGDLADAALLVAYAADRGHAGHLRASALYAYRSGWHGFEVAHLRSVLPLVGDPDPLVRAGAIETLAHAANVSTGDPATQRQLATLAADAHKAIAAIYPKETETSALIAIAKAFVAYGKPLPAHPSGRPVVFTAGIVDGAVEVAVHCLGTAFDAATLRVLAVRGGGTVAAPPHVITLEGCGPQPVTVGPGRSAPAPAVGRYDVSLELKGRAPATNVRIGTLVVDVRGGLDLQP